MKTDIDIVHELGDDQQTRPDQTRPDQTRPDLRLSREDTTVLKGIATIGVFVSHLDGYMGIRTYTKIDNIIGMLGYLFVGVFLFLSGYGVFRQYTIKGEQYICGFMKKRFLPIYIFQCITIALYVLFDAKFGTVPSAKDIAMSFLFGHTVIYNGWYIQVMLLLYLVFFISFSLLRNSFRARLCDLIFIVVYMFFANLIGLSGVWYRTVLMFWVGMHFAEHELVIMDVIERYRARWLWIVLILFIVLTVFRTVSSTDVLKISFAIGTEITWVGVFIALLGTSVFQNSMMRRMLCWIGKLSLEIYLFQGMTFQFSKVTISNKYIATLFSFTVLIVLSVFFHKVFLKIRDWLDT